jgi:hypothetical protein
MDGTQVSEMRTPDFFVIGAPKCGTTALHRWLAGHPEIFVSTKEIHFFGADLDHRRPAVDEAGYRSFFADATDAHKRVGEVAVWYLMSEAAPAEILSFAPDARIIAMLRRPDEMLYSLHSQLLYSGEEDIADFGEALAAEPDRTAGRRIPQSTHRGAEAPPTECLQYARVGGFSAGIARYIETFGADRVHVVLHDDLRADVETTFGLILEFLDVDPDFQPDFSIVNPNTQVRSQAARKAIQGLRWGPLRSAMPGPIRSMGRKMLEGLQQVNTETRPRPPLDPDIAAQIRHTMSADIQALGDILDRDLSPWLEPQPSD